jgi:hypothetical protein
MRNFQAPPQSIFDIVCLYTAQWDKFVDTHFDYMEQAGFNIKFWGQKSERIFKIFMQFADMVSMDFDQK